LKGGFLSRSILAFSAALGADLVTNDVVAIIELVKNSYDAFATTVDIRFEQNTSPSGGNKIGETQPNGNQNTHERIEYAYLEILDDGSGMDRRTLETGMVRRRDAVPASSILLNLRTRRFVALPERRASAGCLPLVWEADWKCSLKLRAVHVGW